MGNSHSQEEKVPLDVTDLDQPKDKDFGNYDFPFENLVIEGGGARGVAYVGALRVLESAGILQNIKRVSGVSAGAITATFVALGLSCADVAAQAEVDLGKILISGGYLQTLVKPVNLYRRFGWETGDRFYEFFGGILEKFTHTNDHPGNPDITFKQLYKMSGIELCIVVTNLDQMTEEYCHVKTTPNMAIRKAVRMSMSIPGLGFFFLYSFVKLSRNIQGTGNFLVPAQRIVVDLGACTSDPTLANAMRSLVSLHG
ncbi:Hypp5643 [Branchiostoma lanceolatum]|uniref:Hypp5643 protein n=1 Tax=Branchiostoma lanceolatum TaxID=7740 RepID=A0A8J9VYA1_BRALA|nr:Hypp5643 [Branchiostoma lanceolatum]